MTPEDKANLFASRLGGATIADALTLAGCEPREVGATAGGRSWVADCPACQQSEALSFADTASGATTIRCRGYCIDARPPMIAIHGACRLTPLTARRAA